MIVSILNQKGGSGKTTISTNLACAVVFKRFGRVILVDSDPQGSARDWNVAGQGKMLNVIGLDRPTLHKDISAIRYHYEWIFIDGAPSLTPMAVSAINCSNIILIPLQPSPYDLWAAEDLIELVRDKILLSDGKTKAAFIISRQIPNTIIGREIREILNQYKETHGISTFKNGTSQRIVYSTSASKGMSVLEDSDSHARMEILNMAQELEEFSL